MRHRLLSIVMPLGFILAQDGCSGESPAFKLEIVVVNEDAAERLFIATERGTTSTLDAVLRDSGMLTVLPGEEVLRGFEEVDLQVDGTGGCLTSGQLWVLRSRSGTAYGDGQPIVGDLSDLDVRLHIEPGFCSDDTEARFVLNADG